MPYARGIDAELWWQATGTGEAVVLVNGLGSPSATWFRLARRLQDHVTVITLDNRGTGLTSARSAPHLVSAMACDVVAVLAAAGHACAHVVGHSMGGLIAQELALEHPDVVRSLVLASTHIGIPHLQLEAPSSAAAALVDAAGRPPAERTAALRALLYSKHTSQEAIDEDEAVRAAHPTSEEGFRNQLLGTSGWERLADLGRIVVPTLVLHGSEDKIVPVSAGERLAAAIPGARFQLIDGAGHALFTDAADITADSVTSFITARAVLGS